MNEFTRNLRTKNQLGVVSLIPDSRRGNRRTWTVTLNNGGVFKIAQHAMATETSVLKNVRTLLAPGNCERIQWTVEPSEFEFGIGTPQSDRDR